MSTPMKRISRIERISRDDGTYETVEFYHYECKNGHTSWGDTGYCYDCAHLQDNQSARAHSFYDKYGLNK